MKKPEIQFIIFDLGNVLIDIYPQKAIDKFSRDCEAPPTVLKELYHSPLHLSFMRGELTPITFFERVREKYHCQLDFDTFLNHWRQIIGPTKSGMRELLINLKSQYSLILLSNTDQLHWEYVLETCSEIQFFDKSFLSFELGLLKPEAEIYYYLLEDLSCKAAECIFIDDTKENIDMAASIGFQTIHASHPEEVTRRLQEYLIE